VKESCTDFRANLLNSFDLIREHKNLLWIRSDKFFKPFNLLVVLSDDDNFLLYLVVVGVSSSK
jgi:hypothetical protein